MSEDADISILLKKLISDQFNYGVNLTRTSAQSAEILVHEIRKCLKRSRSLFRLLKPVIKDQDFHNINEMIGETSRILTFQRESFVNYQAFKEIEGILSNTFSKESNLIINDFLSSEITDAYSNRANAFNNKIVGLAFQLSKLRDLIINLKTRNYSKSMLFLTIERNFNKSSTFFNDSKISLHGEAIHKWRRYCKHVLFELKFSPIEKSPEIVLLSEKIDQLTELLGKEHDLAVLDKILKIKIYSILTQKERVILHQFIERERNSYQKKAFWLGKEIFSKNSLLLLHEVHTADNVYFA